MSAGEGSVMSDVYSGDSVKLLLDRWTEGLAQVLESMTDQRPEVSWRPVSGSLDELGGGREFLWWEQAFQIAPDAAVWIAAPKATWEYTGTLTLKAAGLETIETGEAKNTWIEILGQSLAAMARSIGSLLGHEVTTETGAERAADPSPREWASVSIIFAEAPDGTPPLLVALSPQLVTLITMPAPGVLEQTDPAPARAATDTVGKSVPLSRTMELLLEVDLPVSISFGRARLPMKDVLKLTTGSIVELDRGINEPVEVLVNQCLIARGEVVVVEGNYGVRIQEIVSRQDRLRSLR